MCFEVSNLIQFGSSNFHQEFDLWIYCIVGQYTLSAMCCEIRRSTFDEIDRRSALLAIFEVRCMNSNAVAGFEM